MDAKKIPRIMGPHDPGIKYTTQGTHLTDTKGKHHLEWISLTYFHSDMLSITSPG